MGNASADNVAMHWSLLAEEHAAGNSSIIREWVRMSTAVALTRG